MAPQLSPGTKTTGTLAPFERGAGRAGREVRTQCIQHLGHTESRGRGLRLFGSHVLRPEAHEESDSTRSGFGWKD